MPEPAQRPGALVVGIGQDDRSDDRIGLDLARTLAREPGVPAEVVVFPGELTGLLDLWKGRTLAIVIDAVRAPRRGGSVVRWEWPSGAERTPEPAVSSHSVSLTSVVELGRAIGSLPERLVLFGVVGERFDLGGAPTPAVQRAEAEVLRRVREELARWGAAPLEARHA